MPQTNILSALVCNFDGCTISFLIWPKSVPGWSFHPKKFNHLQKEFWILPSSTSFLAAASRSMTLLTKWTFVTLGFLWLFFLFFMWFLSFLCFLLFSFSSCFSYWENLLSCWFLLFLACFSRSWVDIFSTSGSSANSSACSLMMTLPKCWKGSPKCWSDLNMRCKKIYILVRILWLQNFSCVFTKHNERLLLQHPNVPCKRTKHQTFICCGTKRKIAQRRSWCRFELKKFSKGVQPCISVTESRFLFPQSCLELWSSPNW